MARDTASSPCRRAGLPAEHCTLQMQPGMDNTLSMIDSQHTHVEHKAMPGIIYGMPIDGAHDHNSRTPTGTSKAMLRTYLRCN